MRIRALALAGCGLAFSVGAFAANFVVTTTADSGPGSLREAVDLVNSNNGPDLISFNISKIGRAHV